MLSIKDANGNDITYYDSFAIINPIRYRGYFYDTESGLYYLQSRYYDPVTGRFLNADSIEYLGISGIIDYNLYSYCNCNPCVCDDYNGKWVSSIMGFTFQCGAVFGAALSIYWVYDHYFNHGIYITVSASFCFPCVGITGSWFTTPKNSIYDLNSIKLSIGASFFKYLGIDVLFDGWGICGIQINLGVGASIPIDIHGNSGSSILIPFGKNSAKASRTIRNASVRYKYNPYFRRTKHRSSC